MPCFSPHRPKLPLGSGNQEVNWLDPNPGHPFDPLTRLFNRRAFNERLEQEVSRSMRYGHPMALVLCDLNGFKAVNDTHGHAAGDALLQLAAQRLVSVVRTTDPVFRVGGDEFVILLPQTSKESALVVARRLLEYFRANTYLNAEGLHLNVRASFGMASYPEDAKSAHEIIRQADEMMYLVKNSTRDNISVAQHGMLT